MIKNLKTKLLVTSAIFCFAAVLYLFKIPCPIFNITGIRCFGCGMTHALTAMLKLDFAAAFKYHIMFWSVPILYLCFLKDGKLFKNKILNIAFYVSMSIGFVLNWLRWFVL